MGSGTRVLGRLLRPPRRSPRRTRRSRQLARRPPRPRRTPLRPPPRPSSPLLLRLGHDGSRRVVAGGVLRRVLQLLLRQERLREGGQERQQENIVADIATPITARPCRSSPLLLFDVIRPCESAVFGEGKQARKSSAVASFIY